MILIPFPSKLTKTSGSFRITEMSEIILDMSCDYRELEAVLVLRDDIVKMTGIRPAITKGTSGLKTEKSGEKAGYILVRRVKSDSRVTSGSREASNSRENSVSKDQFSAGKNLCIKEDNPLSYKLTVAENSIVIEGYGGSGLFYGIQTLRQLIRNGASSIPCVEIEDTPSFEVRGFYHDVTRGKVPTLETLKELADRLAFYKINQLQLYVEHSFAFQKHSEIWADSDPITAEEILILDEYCKKRNIELVPSLSTFGHLYHALVSKTFRHLNEYENVPEAPFLWTDRMQHYTLDVCNPQSLEFVYDMINEFLPLFSSDKFNICCDETFDLGQGRNKALLDEVGKGKLYLYFVRSIIEYLKAHKKTVMMWGDILLSHPEMIPEVPKDVIILNWDYRPNATEDNVKTIAEAGLAQYVCPGVGGWNRLVNHMDSATGNIRAMAAHGKKYGARGILNTDWGDFGHINLLSCSIPGAIFGAGLSWNADDLTRPTDEEISILEYGDRSGKLTGLIRDLSRQASFSWDTVVLWYYTTSGLCQDACGYRESHIKQIMACDEKHIKSAYDRIRELKCQLSDLHQSIFEDRKADLDEIIVSADGMALFQALFLVIKKRFLGQADTGLLINPQELAVKLEFWLTEYKTCWRRRNKESELYRIKDVITGICKLLRKL